MTYNTFLLSARKGQTKRFAELKPRSVSSRASIRAAVPEAGKHSLWISDHPKITGELLRSIHWPTRQIGRAVLLFMPKVETLATLRTCFDRVAFGLPDSFLQGEELAAALAAESSRDLFIGGTVDQASQT